MSVLLTTLREGKMISARYRIGQWVTLRAFPSDRSFFPCLPAQYCHVLLARAGVRRLPYSPAALASWNIEALGSTKVAVTARPGGHVMVLLEISGT